VKSRVRSVASAIAVAVAILGAGSVPVERADARSERARAGSEHAHWEWPLRPAPVVRGFEAPPTPYAAGHRGIDLAAIAGAAVTAPAAGTVRFVGVVADRPVVTLDHGGGVLSSYEPVSADVSPPSALTVGATIRAGESIGVVATGGHCDARCLHVGVRIDGAYVSPLLFFDRVPRAILLPLSPRSPSIALTRWAGRRLVKPGDGRSGSSP
jgi:murein DD-endopeptidase MepM/ murein hydrolase activator NlpD